MQATGLNPHYSASAPKAQSTDTSASMTINESTPMNWIPIFRQSRPRNPSWLSYYDITVPGEITRPILSVVNQSGFEIGKNKPVTTPDELIRFESNIAKVLTLYKDKKFKEALKTAITLVNILSSNPEANNLILYLNSVIFLCHIMQDMTSCLHLPAADSEDFINWLLDIAYAASDDTGPLPTNSKLMLFCWRWAADAGSQRARQLLIKALLFSESCPDTLSTDVNFFPAEASRHLSDMAQDNTQLPSPMDYHEVAINKMVKLVKLRNTTDFNHEKNELVKFLRAQPYPEIQLLIPFIYTSEAFGAPEYDEARNYLEELHTHPDEKQNSPFVENVYQFWQVTCALARDDSATSTIETLNQLAQQNFLAAIHLLSELARTHKDLPHKYVTPFIQAPKPHFSEYPDLAYSLYSFHLESIKPKSDSAKGNRQKQRLTEMNSNATQLLNDLTIQANPETRDLLLYAGFKSIFEMDNLRKIGREPVRPLPESTVRILTDCQYTQDPAALTYLHCAQVLKHGKGDGKLIETAEQKNALSTYFHMLVMSDATATIDDTVLVDRLLDTPSLDFRAWWKHPGMGAFFHQLHMCGLHSRKPEQCYLLCIELSHATGKPKCDNINNLNSLAKEKILQDNPMEACHYYEQAWDLEDPFLKRRSKSWKEKVPEGYQIRRAGLPDYYQQLSSIRTVSAHPLETHYRFNQFMSVWEHMQESKDPSLLNGWVETACNFLNYSYWHISPDMCQTLIERCNLTITKQHMLSITLAHSTINQLMILVNNALDKSTTGTPHHSTLQAYLLRMKRSLTDHPASFQEAHTIDEMAKLPFIHSSYNAYMKHHHIMPKIQAAESIDDIIENLKRLTIEHEFDPATLVRLVTKWFTLLPMESSTEILSLLQKKLEKYLSSLNEIKFTLESQLLWATNNYYQNHTNKTSRSMKNAIEKMEKQKTALLVKKPEQMLRNRHGLSEEESDLYFWAGNSCETKAEFRFQYFIHNIRLYHPRTILKIFFHGDMQSKEQCISKIRKIKIRNKESKHFVRFFIYQLESNKSNMESFLDETLRGRALDDEEKSILLWYAYESSLITDDVLAQQTVFLDQESPHYLFIRVLIEDDRHADLFSNLASSSKIMSLGMHYQHSVGFKLLSLGKLKDAADMWFKCQSAYHLAILTWHHGIQPRTNIAIDVTQQLLTAAEKGQVKAQCELIHWLLLQQKKGKVINPLLKYRSCRFVHMPTPLAGGESVLYQGITQYLGFGCDADPVVGEDKIRKALTQDPLTVALRLYDLKEQGLFELPNEKTDYLLLYSQALSERCNDPFSRRDNYFTNLLLSYGIDKLQRLLATLHNRAEADPLTQPTFQNVADLLNQWISQWQGVAVSPIIPIMETPKVLPSCNRSDVERAIERAIADDWKSCAIVEMDNLISKLREGETDLDTETQEELCTLLVAMPLRSLELANHADVIIDHISKPEKITEIITSWMTTLIFTDTHEQKALLADIILRSLPKGQPIEPQNREEILHFLDFLIHYRPIPEEARYLLDTISVSDREGLLLKGLPEGVHQNPEIYQQYVSTSHAPSFHLIHEIWRILKPENETGLIRETLKALTTQEPLQLQGIGLNNEKLQNINLYTLFDEFRMPARKWLLENTPTLPIGLIEPLIKSHKEKPSKPIPPQHLDKCIRDFVRGEQHYSMTRLLEILIMTESNKVNPSLLQAYTDKIKKIASEVLNNPVITRDQQDIRLSAYAILTMLS
ncbi:hypothetical protein GCM10023116_01380 [Kistimonas scapharcae]|uniref:Uncharacterized protein n=1 Tax=Kistimonas scapharcae TaxID=1036133 RepID=A0ABP8UVF9_9GAMM